MGVLRALSRVVPAASSSNVALNAVRIFATDSGSSKVGSFASKVIRSPDGGKYQQIKTSQPAEWPAVDTFVKPADLEDDARWFHINNAKAFPTEYPTPNLGEKVEWSLDDHNGAAGSFLKEDAEALAHFTNTHGDVKFSASTRPNTVAGQTIFKRELHTVTQFPQDIFDLDPLHKTIAKETFARDFIARLNTRIPYTVQYSQFLGEFNTGVKSGKKPYKLTQYDLERFIQSESINPTWREDLKRLAAEGRVNHRSLHEALNRYELTKDYLRLQDFSAS